MNTSRLIALRVLSIDAVPAPALLHLSDFGREIPIAGYAWLFRNDHDASWVLIDTGTQDVAPLNEGRPPSRHWHVHSLTEALAQQGVALEEIKDVVLTHLHADHCGSVGLFPNARWHVPKVEWEFVCDRSNDRLAPETLFPRNAIETMKTHGVICLKDGDQPTPGMRVKHLGGHSVGLMAIEILGLDGETKCVLGGDVMPLYENLERRIAPGTLWHWGECMQALDSLSQCPASVLPGHDPKLLEIYPQGVILDG